MWVSFDACISIVSMKFEVILETERVVSTALACAYMNPHKSSSFQNIIKIVDIKKCYLSKT